MEVLCEMIVDFDNLKTNDYELTRDVKSQGWEEFFNHLQGPICPELVKQFWIHATASKLQISSYILRKKFCISEKSITKLLNHDGTVKICFNMPFKKAKLEEIATVIFPYGKSLSNAKNPHKRLRVWLRILLGCVHYRPSSNSSNYINTDQNYMLYYISYRIRINLPSILFKYMRELANETRNGGTKIIKWIPIGRLIFDMIVKCST